MNGLPQPAYVMSEPHLSGYRVIIGYETLTDVQNAQAALCKPQAREEAQPVAWVVRKGLSTGSLFYTERGQNADLPDGTLLYTTPPAPEAENLRVAVEALEKASRAISAQYALAQAEYHHLDTVASKHDKIVQEGRRAIREALAALQQEGR